MNARLRFDLTAVAVAVVAAAGPILLHPSVVPGPWRLPIAVGAALVALVIAATAARPLRWAHGALVVLAITAVIAWDRAPSDHAKALSHFTNIGLGLLTLVAVARWCDTRTRLMIVATLMCGVGIAALVTGMIGTEVYYAKFLPLRLPQTRNLYLEGLDSNTLVNPNALGAFAAALLPVAWYLTRAWTGMAGLTWLARSVGAVTWVLCAGVMLFTQSRSAWLAVLLTALGWGLWRYRGRWKRVVGVTAAIVVCVGLTIAFTFPPGLRRVASDSVDRVQERFIFWQDAGASLAASPWFGIGLNTFHSARRPGTNELQPVAHAHNTFVQVALDVGVIGLLAYLALLVFLLLEAHEATRSADPAVAGLAAAGAATLLILHLFGLADAVALGAKLGQFQWVTGGLTVAAARLYRAERPRLPPPE